MRGIQAFLRDKAASDHVIQQIRSQVWEASSSPPVVRFTPCGGAGGSLIQRLGNSRNDAGDCQVAMITNHRTFSFLPERSQPKGSNSISNNKSKTHDTKWQIHHQKFGWICYRIFSSGDVATARWYREQRTKLLVVSGNTGGFSLPTSQLYDHFTRP
jgi:hypothetical protein